MIEVTSAAQDQVVAYFADKEIMPVRIFVTTSCGGSQLAMALDEKKDTDSAYAYNGVEYIMDRELLEKARPVRIDYSGNGFRLESSLNLSNGCSSCGTKGSCCS